MKIAFIIQNLAHLTDSIGYDCLFEYRILNKFYGNEAEISIFSVEFDTSIHQGIPIRPFKDFSAFIKKYPDTKVIYHFCDGWDGVDDFIIKNVRNCFIRWHNNTTPWFYALDAVDFARGCVRGFQIINRFARSGTAHFMVNSEFSRRQLEALDGDPARIKTVFPASMFLNKPATAPTPSTSRSLSEVTPIRLLFVGRIVPHKGHRHVLTVAHLVQTFLKRPVEVIFVGSIEQRLEHYIDELKEIAERLEVDTRLTGAVTDAELLEIYDEATVFLCLSEHEGFGMPVFEAMRCQLPVVAWASSAFSDLLEAHPLASATFDVYRFAASVLAALHPDIKAEIQAIQYQILQTYTADIVTAQLLNALGETMAMPVADPIASPSPRIEEVIADIMTRMRADETIAPQIFDHDASINYMSLHDIRIYNRLLEYIEDSGKLSTARLPGDRLKDLADLHPHYHAIQHIMTGGRGTEVEPIRQLDALLEFDDEAFIRLAYSAVLGREVDQSGLSTYLRRLRSGYDKKTILTELQSSAEGRRQDFEIEGLKPLGQSFLAKVSKQLSRNEQRRHSDESRLHRMEEQIRRLRNYLAPPPVNLPAGHPAGSIHHVDDLLRLGDRAFVTMAYHILLDRAGDEEGVEFYINALRDDLKRLDFLTSLATSEEGQKQERRLPGLQEALDRHATGDITDIAKNMSLSGRIMRMSNELGILTSQLIARGDLDDHARSPIVEPVKQLLQLLPAGSCEADIVLQPELNPVRDALPAATVQHIHQIFINQNGTIPATMPDIVQDNIASIKNQHPDASYKLWSGSELRQFIKQHFNQDVLHAYDTLKAYALKADLARYCLLYIHGGLYSDLSNRFINPVLLPAGKALACFRDHKPLHGAIWMAQNTIIYAEAQQPEIKLAIDLVVANVRNKDYGVSSLAPSGPVLFDRVFAALGRCAAYHIGEAINLQVDGALNRSCYVDPQGRLIAARLQGSGGKPSQLGLRDTNVYGDMWDRREIYGENITYLPYDDPQLANVPQSSGEGADITDDNDGQPITTTSLSLPRGHYIASLGFASSSRFTGNMEISVRAAKTGKILASRQNALPDSAGRISLSFDLTEQTGTIVTLTTMAGFSGRFLDLTVARDRNGAMRKAATAATTSPPSLEEPVPLEQTGEALGCIHQLLPMIDGGDWHEDAETNLHAIRQIYPQTAVRSWQPEQLRDFIGDHFPKDVIHAYDALAASTYKTDLARYCLLAKSGGLVLDADIRCITPMIIPHGKTVGLFRSARASNGTLWNIDLGMIYAAPGQMEIREAIEGILNNVAQRHHGSTPDSPTGGELLGRLLAASYRPHHYLSGEVVALTDGFPVRNECFLGQDGKLAAVRMSNRPTTHVLQALSMAARTSWLDRDIYRYEAKGTDTPHS